MSAAIGLFTFGIGSVAGCGLARWSQLGTSCLVGGVAAAALHRRSTPLTRLASGGVCGVAATLLLFSSSKVWEAFLLKEPSQLLFASYQSFSTVGFGMGLSSELYSLASGIEEGEGSAQLLCDRVAALFKALCGRDSLRFALVEIGGSIFVPGGEWIFEPAWREGVESDHLLQGVNLWLQREGTLEGKKLGRFLGLIASTSNLPFEQLEEREQGVVRSFIDQELNELKLPEIGKDEADVLERYEAFTKRFLLVERLLKQTSTPSEEFKLLQEQFRDEKYQSAVRKKKKCDDPEHNLYSSMSLTAPYYDQLATHFGLSSSQDVAGHLLKMGITKSWVLKEFKTFKSPEQAKEYNEARYNWLLNRLPRPVSPFERGRRGMAVLLYHTVALSGAVASLVTAPLLYGAGVALGGLTNYLPSFAPKKERPTASIGDGFRASPPFILAGSGLASLHLGRGTLRERADRFSRLPSLLQMRILSAELCQDCLAVQCGRWGAFARGWLAGGELRRQTS